MARVLTPRRLPPCREWHGCDPLNPQAAGALVHELTSPGRRDETARVAARSRDEAAEAGLPATSVLPPSLDESAATACPTGLRAEREAHITLVRQGWGRAEPTYRQILSATFMPGATHGELDWFNAFQRQTASAANAARFLEVFADIDVRRRLSEVRAPALVMHARDDQRVPVRTGGALAAGVAGAEFVALESANHILLGREPASADFMAQVRQFLGECG